MANGGDTVRSVVGLKLLNTQELAAKIQVSPQWAREHAAEYRGMKVAGKWLFFEEVVEAVLEQCSTSKRPLSTGGSKSRRMAVSIENPLDRRIDEKLRELNAT